MKQEPTGVMHAYDGAPLVRWPCTFGQFLSNCDQCHKTAADEDQKSDKNNEISIPQCALSALIMVIQQGYDTFKSNKKRQ